MKRIAIFASGGGSNAKEILEYFNNSIYGEVVLILTNNPKSGVLNHATAYNVPATIFSKSDFKDTDIILNKLVEINVDLIALAGFLWLVPQKFMIAFPNKIINIHPALLPKFGGKGMYGNRIHQAVIDQKEHESGMTIHFVNENFDEGEIIFQASCDVLPEETAQTLAQKILKLEHVYYPEVINSLL